MSAKGKQPAGTPLSLPKAPPSAGSANPSASLPALWSYIEPALDHIMRSPTNDTTRAPAVDVEYHMGIHTAVYNYFTAQSDGVPTSRLASYGTQSGKAPAGGASSGQDIYEKLDDYFADTAREVLLGAPHDDSELLPYLLPCFARYSASGSSVHRLLNYVNRHYVKRVVGEDHGWLRLADMLHAVTKASPEDDTREKIALRLRERRNEELRKWGWEEGATAEQAAAAEACAEAAASLDRIVPITSLAHRRFRTEVVEPLLAVPKKKGGGKAKRKDPQKGGPGGVPGPKGRLARAVKELIEVRAVEDAAESRRLAADLANVLKVVGVKPDHVLRKKLQKFLILSKDPCAPRDVEGSTGRSSPAE